MSVLQAEGIVLRRGTSRLLDGVDVRVEPGQVLAILGPNGAGKSSLIRVLAGELSPDAGEVTLAGRRLDDWDRQALARRRAVLPQSAALAFPFRVDEVVWMGRSPHGQTASAEDRRAIEAVMALTDIGHLADREYPTLSGGERQRVQIARVLAQVWPGAAPSPAWLLLDEPTSALDIAHQLRILAAIRSLASEGVGVAMVVHDLNLAARFADRLLLLKAGRSRGEGPREAMLVPSRLEPVFGVEVDVAEHPAADWPLLVCHER